MDNNEIVAKRNEEKGKEDFKRLAVLLEGKEFSEFLERVSEIRKRADKLYAAGRGKQAAMREAVAREKERERELAMEAELAAKASPESAQPVSNVSEPDSAEKAETAETAKPEPVETHAESEAKPTVPESENSEKKEVKTEQPEPAKPAETTRTAIPSYIRGVVRHAPKPPERPREPRSKTPAQGGARTSTRPQAPRPVGARTSTAMPKFDPPAAQRKREPAGKKAFAKPEDKRQMSKRTLIHRGYIQENVEEERMGTRKLKNKKINKVVPFAPIVIENAVITTENLTVKILSEKIGKTAQEIIKQLMELGIMTTINSVVDFPTMQLVADALGVNIELKLEKTKEEELLALHSEPDAAESLRPRPPIVTVMGHVDHGKTSLLDAIRKTSVAEGEAGGITQHIGAYSVELNGQKITFLDTPGHEAFTEMRRRGAMVTDIAVLIVAADDGVMPQTVEAIKHAKEAGVPIVVAINKIDKPGANAERIKQQLAEHELLPEEWGGDVPMIPISAKKGTGIDDLLENILFKAEEKGLSANPDRYARGYVIEARLDKGRGPIASAIVQNGTLHVGDFIVSGKTYGKVRSLTDDRGNIIKAAGPSMPVAVYGLAQVPSAGDPIVAVESEKMARQVIEERAAKARVEMLENVPTTDPMKAFENAPTDKEREIRLIIKSDVQGSSEALKDAVVKLSNDEIKISVVHTGVGNINKSDVMLADVAKARIIGFNVKPDGDGRSSAERLGVSIKLYSIIYDVIDEITAEIESMLAPKMVERITGKAQVRSIFKVSGVGIVAGSYVQTGKIVRGGKARLYRGGKQIFDGNIVGLKRFKDDAKEVTIGLECGIALGDYTDYLEDDIIECYVIEKETK